MSQPNAAAAAATISFTLSSASASSSTRCAPRTGTLVSRRADSEKEIQIQTPNLMTTTSRGVVPHLSRDHHRGSAAIKWVNVPFENFLEQNPPLPLLQPGSTPLHTLLGFTPSTHLLSLTARDPSSAYDMPPNSNTHISVSSLRGVRKLTADAWREYCAKSKPDVVMAMSDTPFTDPPYSQKRMTKSIERSAAWLANLLRTAPGPVSTTSSSSSSKKKRPSASKFQPQPVPSSDPTQTEPRAPLPPIFVHLAGGASPGARKAFAASLTEPLYGPEAAAVAPLRTLDEGVAGYVVDLAPLKLELGASSRKALAAAGAGSDSTESSGLPPLSPSPFPSSSIPSSDSAPGPSVLPSTTSNEQEQEQISPLIATSLSALPASKPLLINSAQSPHEILYYITHLGADVFDAQWAQRAADVGIALDFEFPVHVRAGEGKREGEVERKREQKKEIGHNLYEKRYALDFSPFADAFRGASTSAQQPDEGDSSSKPICMCAACSPIAPGAKGRLYHGVDTPEFSGESVKETGKEEQEENENKTNYRPAYTRAYVHHLLHTHEMGAHALLVMHNLAVVDAFFRGVRGVIGASSSSSSSSSSDAASSSSTHPSTSSIPTTTTTAPPPSSFSSSPQTSSSWEDEVRRFLETYDSGAALFGEAERRWRAVDRARGKGRLAREKEKEKENANGNGKEKEDKGEEGVCVLEEP